MKKIIYRKKGMTPAQQLKLDMYNLKLFKVIKHLGQSVTGFTLRIYRMYLFAKFTHALKKWPEGIKVPLVIAVIDKE